VLNGGRSGTRAIKKKEGCVTVSLSYLDKSSFFNIIMHRESSQCARYFIEVKRMMVFTPPKASIHQTATGRRGWRWIRRPAVYFSRHSKLKKRSANIRHSLARSLLALMLKHKKKNAIQRGPQAK
jgi:hypothetical protein